MTPSLTLFPDFAAASHDVLALLQEQLGLGLWLVTRTIGNDWIVLGTANREPRYDHIHAGDVLVWSDSFCSRMVRGEAPNVAADARAVVAYRDAPISRQLPIGAYVGVPILQGDGSLFGTLCAIDPEPQDRTRLAGQERTLHTVARLLATLLDRELRLEDQQKQLERAEHSATVDALTELWNRRAWDAALVAEEARCKRYGHPACVLSIDVDGLKSLNDTQGHVAGDDLLQRCAGALKKGVREHDGVARVGGDEFAVLLVQCDELTAIVVELRLRETLAAASVSASIGLAKRDPRFGLVEAVSRADAAMYEEKRARKAAR